MQNLSDSSGTSEYEHFHHATGQTLPKVTRVGSGAKIKIRA